MYFKARNGTYKRVPQYPNALLGSLTGGMTVYYLQQDFNSNGKTKITSFKPVREHPNLGTRSNMLIESGFPYDCR